MGQAKKRAVIKDRLRTYDFAAVASAIRRLALAASSHLGSDCYMLSVLARELLRIDGISAQLVVGYAGWRCGSGDSDVIMHCPVGSIPPQKGFVYHVWLEIEIINYIFDVTTFSLRQKARDLDLLDGGTTTVDWCPDYLFVPKSSVSALHDVIQKQQGMYFYERQQQVEQIIVASAPDLDPGDLDAAILVHQNQDTVVFGPNTPFLGGI